MVIGDEKLIHFDHLHAGGVRRSDAALDESGATALGRAAPHGAGVSVVVSFVGCAAVSNGKMLCECAGGEGGQKGGVDVVG